MDSEGKQAFLVSKDVFFSNEALQCHHGTQQIC